MSDEKTTFESLVSLLGVFEALSFCEQYGGQTLYIRKDGELPEGTAKHWADHFGPEAYGRIVESMGGKRVYIPAAPKKSLDIRDEAIYRARKSGFSTAKLAKDYRLTPRTIHGIVSRFAQSNQPATSQEQGV